MWYGIVSSIGRCEKLQEESVATSFTVIGPLLLPMQSAWTTEGWPSSRGFYVKTHLGSVALAYLRWVIPPIVLFITFLNGTVYEKAGAPLAKSVVLTLLIEAAVWVVLMFGTGHVWGPERRRRIIMRAIVGHSAPPELLFDTALRTVLEGLEQMWTTMAAKEGKSAYRDPSAEECTSYYREVFPVDVAPAMLPLYYTMCRYDAALNQALVMQNRADLAWRRMVETGLIASFLKNLE
jgi:hypothetical protein